MDQVTPVSHKRELLRVAREAAREFLSQQPAEQLEEVVVKGNYGGIFVTFWAGKTLRGCRGLFATLSDVVEAVRETTRLSLTDPRFLTKPVTLKELDKINIEISLLSEPVPTNNPQGLTPGVHGIVIRSPVSSGCFLPKVATECGWSAREFLSNCCTMKAGLPADAWKESSTQVELFTADVFAESDYS